MRIYRNEIILIKTHFFIDGFSHQQLAAQRLLVPLHSPEFASSLQFSLLALGMDGNVPVS
jgi:hypothetical protein